MAAGTRRITSVFAGAGVIENILAGSPLEYPGIASSVEVASAIVAAAAGTVTMDVLIGTDLVAEGITVPVEDAAGQGPKLPDALLVVEAAGPADHVQIRLRASGAVTDITTLVRIQPV